MAKKKSPATRNSPMTKKRKHAIYRYTKLHCIDYASVDIVIQFTLEGVQMNTDSLYNWLSKRGYIWDSRRGVWRMKKSI